RCQDFLGSSTYPAWGVTKPWDDEHPGDGRIEKHTALLNEVWENISMRFDYLRCSNRPGAPVWAAEFQGGPVSTRFQKGRVPDAADIRRWMLSAVASGTTAISFWVTRVEIMSSEANGFGLLDSVGDDTPRFAEAARVGTALINHADLFAQSTTPTPTVGIFIDENLFNFMTSIKEGGENLTYSVRGWYRLLWDAGIPVDFVCSSTLDERPLADYHAIIMPLPLAHSEETAGKLAEYVNGGGNLICEAAPGRLDEHGFCRRGELSPTLAALFGVQHKGFQLVREPGDAKRWSPRERTWGEYRNATMLTGVGPLAGGELRANLYLETYTLAGGEACLRAGEDIAGVTRAVGAGHAWLIGSYIGHGGTAHRDKVSRALVLNLLKQCSITPAHPGKFLLRKRITKSKEAWLFTNPKAEMMTEKVSVAGFSKVTDLFGEQMSIYNDSVSLAIESLDVRVLILER
ncbi:MAG: beta-galactosidase trimerization domain-containing protein, partial [bacterium]